ncbi:hypothetical protein [Streptomyces neyagawaensis]|uniref:hypothetical protein n=1 Tax=Streptomyces neyagawaensis TaxID=42238 RepID=UPI0006E3DA4E|nr:hypothetical protein [Streptomyces neyagawaensis]MCL6735849.1 hypothetical protein [Streptomyces neyagawaensis]MDE1686345.1 hypothetical protein [Streptomyces neyagawaensis]
MTTATHIWVPFRDTSLFVEFAPGADGPDRAPGHQELLIDVVPSGGVTRDNRYGEPLWRVDAEHLHAVVEALWTADRPLRIHLDQAPRHGREHGGCDE